MKVLLMSDGEFTYSENSKIKCFQEKNKFFVSFDNIGVIFEIAQSLFLKLKQSIQKSLSSGLGTLFLEVDFVNELIKDCWE